MHLPYIKHTSLSCSYTTKKKDKGREGGEIIVKFLINNGDDYLATTWINGAKPRVHYGKAGQGEVRGQTE